MSCCMELLPGGVLNIEEKRHAMAGEEGGSPFAQTPPGTLREQREARRRHLSTDLYHKPET